MYAEPDFAQLAIGLVITGGVVLAFLTWLVFPILPFLLLGALYAVTRYGIPVVTEAALRLEERGVRSLKIALRGGADWVLVHVPAPSRQLH